jgi:hypothetical protein
VRNDVQGKVRNNVQGEVHKVLKGKKARNDAQPRKVRKDS